ncbi:type II toxin-antitoxin system RelB/DinJ family antitoxin [Microvirga massiliensis]|uniref:type II toxin-antitoxin system RelB/DinJ family antitoxin n=1 Tax=Microvirga massiliensis TaxID=1033741 RepID=UPI00062BDC1E|nr:type II toxin-antitoxin system RelB/DinJ family antitoxin [Microvirga massiliensis]
MAQDATVRARISAEERDAAVRALSEIGLTVSDAIRLMLKRVAAEGALPFEVRVPNARTVEAMEDARAGRVKRTASVDDLLTDADDADGD